MLSAARTEARRLAARLLALVVAALALGATPARAQLGTLASPGPLTKAHAALEGLANCQKCHEPGRKVTASRCLTCHKPIADRIARRTGVHRDVKDDCVSCHVEHAGADAELRPFDVATFDHATETGFPLDGLHAPLARQCARCHKTRSFLTLQPSCVSCHADAHKGTLGTSCTTCHSTKVAFKNAARGFDHTRTDFPLTGAHERVACASCHKAGQFKGLRFRECGDCHRDPHEQRFGASCSACHATASWRTQKVDHARTAFRLVGQHQTVACVKCHAQAPMRATPKFAACSSCHADPHQGKFKERCEACHDENGFKRAATTFDHASRTSFALTGAHARLDCARCHVSAARPPGRRAQPARGLDFAGLKADCASCHTDPHKGELGAVCAQCHSTSTFKVTAFTHGAHAELFRGAHAAAACAACHVRGTPAAPSRTAAPLANVRFKGVPTACASCHEDPHLGQVSTACESCHDVEGRKFALVSFSHDRAAFALTGAHRDVACEKCHKVETGVFPAKAGTARRLKGLASDCASCHRDEHDGQLGQRCETCHTTARFSIDKYTHRGLDGFFVGRHARLECASCHTREPSRSPAGRAAVVRFKTGTECSACHDDAHRGAMGASCATCHSPEQWQVANRGFHKSTVFPLEGRHLGVACQSCHVNGQLKGTPTRCFDCHWIRRQDDRYETRLGNECEECHRPASWTSARWDHGARTGTPLNAAHRMLACEGCHRERRFEGTRPECVACHEQDYRAARAPDHVAAGFPLQCDVCHRAVSPSFAGAHFTHASFTLVGQHTTQPCAACHRANVYQGTPRDCIGCHQAEFQRTQNPNHAAAGFPTACESCHRATDTTWQAAAFDHAAFFPLTGAHATQACASCHRDNVYRGTPRDCVGCHQADYQRAQNPNHAAAGFPMACESCHRPTAASWTGATFNHAQVFVLNGSHATTACQSCHRNGQYRGTPRDCVGCHQADYQRTQNPNHVAASFSTGCEACHRSGGPGWRGAAINHSQFWPLLGTHNTTACVSCHKSGQYRGTPRECYPCHQAQYQQAQNPSHAAAGFPTACEQCHRNGGPGWRGATFNHNQFFTLQGAHASQACAACHRNGQYRGTPRDCAGCHLSRYQATRNPNHQAAGFPTACETCHRASDSSWGQGRFDHTWFPITSGKHAGNPCSACHQDANNYRSFTCLTCHDRAKTDDKHKGRAGYRYDSAACYSCHPQGRE